MKEKITNSLQKQKLLIGMYLFAIILANFVLAKWGLNELFTIPGLGAIQVLFFAHLVFIGLDLTARDFLHDLWKEDLWKKMLILIISGSVLSLVFNLILKGIGWDGAPWNITIAVGLGSALAFICAGIADTLTYQFLGKKSRLLRINGSNVVSGIIDSIIFLTFSFGIFFPILNGESWSIGSAIMVWPIIQSSSAKIIGGFIWAYLIVRLTQYLKLGKYPNKDHL